MQDSYEIEMDELAVNLTRPPTKFGVPFMPFFLNAMVCFFGWMLYQAITGNSDLFGILIFIMIWFLNYAFMYFLTSKDIFGLTIYWINVCHFRQLPTHAVWGNTDSYRP